MKKKAIKTKRNEVYRKQTTEKSMKERTKKRKRNIEGKIFKIEQRSQKK
jgi:hypothetical protein